MSYRNSTEGMSFFVHLLLKENHPSVTPDDAYRIMEALGQEAAKRVLATCAGELPPSSKNGQAPAA